MNDAIRNAINEMSRNLGVDPGQLLFTLHNAAATQAAKWDFFLNLTLSFWAIGIFLALLTAWVWDSFAYKSEPIRNLLQWVCSATIICAMILTLFTFTNYSDGIMAKYDPSGWAIQQVLNAISSRR